MNDAARAAVVMPRVLLDALKATIVGQHEVLEAVVLGLIAGGHLLLEGSPGLAKTLVCRALACAVGGHWQRVQFTPDLLPSDIVGTRIFDQHSGEFRTVLGPIFANILLADEINRAPAKVQSALLEAMQERQVTIGTQSHRLPDPFIVTATMNPLDADGTYALAQAQTDRFMMKVLVAYPSAQEEVQIVERFSGEPPAFPAAVVSTDDVIGWRHAARTIFVERKLIEYAVDLVAATRRPHEYIERGASPRASLAVVALGRARALLEGRTFVYPEDVRAVAPAVLRHRISFNYRALADHVDTEAVLRSV
ncbi:MAG TPA: MoxR family ATPase, partial [Candidatus Acidoferrales bacterium]|nr:MoxR family ATPase [Candidatus Acidoferrales bacterium]